MIGIFLKTLIPIAVAMDPLGNVPIFLGLAEGMTPRERRRVVAQAVVTAAVAGALFIAAGRAVFSFLGIEPYDFQIGGGLVLLTLALAEMLGARPAPAARESAGVVPLGIPFVAGPAVLTMLVIMVDLNGARYTAVAFAVSLGATALAFAFAGRIAARLGMPALRAIDRIVNLLVVAIAVMMIRRGVEGIVAGPGGG